MLDFVPDSVGEREGEGEAEKRRRGRKKSLVVFLDRITSSRTVIIQHACAALAEQNAESARSWCQAQCKPNPYTAPHRFLKFGYSTRVFTLITREDADCILCLSSVCYIADVLFVHPWRGGVVIAMWSGLRELRSPS